ncbi:MAG: MarR family transcriptional regulator [Alphaproteobacteria bacterium]|nr:MAG: MarR family transcriptional regulator [Alphaproteobacteria bacterium]
MTSPSMARSGRARRKAALKAQPRRENGKASYALPPTATHGALLERGSDRRFRALVNDLFTVTARMEIVRGHLGGRMGVSGPQYSVLIAVAHLQGERGIAVGAVARAMHVSSAFVASETGKMAQRGLLLKRPNPDDRRSVLLRLAPAGRVKINHIAAEIRAINDLFFGALDAASFCALSTAAAALVQGSGKALHYLSAVDSQTHMSLRAAG